MKLCMAIYDCLQWNIGLQSDRPIIMDIWMEMRGHLYEVRNDRIMKCLQRSDFTQGIRRESSLHGMALSDFMQWLISINYKSSRKSKVLRKSANMYDNNWSF